MSRETPSRHYVIKDTDITDFVYKLHVLLGDYRKDAGHNLNIMKNEKCSGFIALAGDNAIILDNAAFAYQRGMDLNQRLFTSEHLHGYAFLLQVNSRNNSRAYGDVLFIDCAALRQDVERHALSPIGIVIADKKGREKAISFEEWSAMELYEKNALHSWGYQYPAVDEKGAPGQSYSNLFEQLKARVEPACPSELLTRLNLDYMLEAVNFVEDMYRIPRETAKQMLLHDDAPVYRLVPGEAVQLTPIAAIKTGLWYSEYREFAIAPIGWKGFEKACSREIDKLTGRTPERAAPEKPHPMPER